MGLLQRPFLRIHPKTGGLPTHSRHAALKHSTQPRRTPMHVRKFKGISDEVPSAPSVALATGHCRKPRSAGIQALSQLSHTKKKKSHLHKSCHEIIFKVFPLPNQKNKTSADRGNFSVSTAAAENLFSSRVVQGAALITAADGSIISSTCRRAWAQP